MRTIGAILKYLLTFLFVASAGYFLFITAAPLLVAPCEKPIEYSIGSIDPRFGLSTSTLVSALSQAAVVWNKEAGKTLVMFNAEQGIPVNLVFTEVEQATQLGKTINAEQEAYDDAKRMLENLKSRFDSLSKDYESALSSFNARRERYEAEVEKWNTEGGAPPARYEVLKEEKQELFDEQKDLHAQASTLNDLVSEINSAVSALNAAAKKINAKVDVYNKTAGNDYDQGSYTADKDGKRITIFEYENTTDLARVLAHEFGHALGLDHVENPSSIMYSYNLGTGLTLTEEDKEALKTLCGVE